MEALSGPRPVGTLEPGQVGVVTKSAGHSLGRDCRGGRPGGVGDQGVEHLSD